MDTLRLAFTQALRGLAAQPRFTFVVLVTFGIAIGANAALFTLVHALLLRPLPFPDANRIAQIERPPLEFGPDGVRVLRELTDHPLLRATAVYMTAAGANLDDAAGAERIGITQVDAMFFDVFAMRSLLGRTFLAEEAVRGGNHVLVLSERLWRGRFGSDLEIAGKIVRINGNSFTVVGVMPDAFRFPAGTEAWVPLPVIGEFYVGANVPEVVARIAPNMPLAEVDAALRAAMRVEYTRRSAEVDEQQLPRLVGLQDRLTSDARMPLLILFGATGLLLLAACTNVAGLLLSRLPGRRHELAIQRALGASRARVAGRALAEAVLLAAAGGVAGILIAWWSEGLLGALTPAGILPDAGPTPDTTMFLFSAALVIACTLVCGALPAMRSTRVPAIDVLRTGGMAGIAPRRLQATLVATQIATAIVVALSAGLLARSYARAHAVPLGIEPEGTLTFRVQLPLATYSKADQINALVEDFESRMLALPGVLAVGATSDMPLSEQMGVGVQVDFEGEVPRMADAARRPSSLYAAVTPGYFQAMGIPVRRGRSLEPADALPGSAGFMINDAFVRTRLSGENPIGRRLTLRTLRGESRPGQIVGVVADVRHRGAEHELVPQVFEPFQRAPTTWLHFAIRTNGDPRALVARVRTTLAGIDPTVAPFGMRTLEDAIATSLRARRFTMQLLMLFAAGTLLLSILGLYGTIAQTVEAGRREIGVRMTLGADARRIVALILLRSVQVAGPGVVLGLFLSFAAVRWTRSLLFGIQAHDPLTWGLVLAVVITAVLVAAWIPARRAARLDPAVTLRGN